MQNKTLQVLPDSHLNQYGSFGRLTTYSMDMATAVYLSKALVIKAEDPVSHDVAVAGSLHLLHLVDPGQLIKPGEEAVGRNNGWNMSQGNVCMQGTRSR